MTASTPNHALTTSWLKRSDQWRQASARLEQLRVDGQLDVDTAGAIAEDYRLLARDLAIGRRVAAGSRTTQFLEATYALLHAQLHRPAVRPAYLLASLFRERIPEAMSSIRPQLAWITVLFLVALATGWWAVSAAPGLARLFASQEMITVVERGELWTDGLLNVMPSAVLSVQLLTNNVLVSLFAYCCGFLFGLGTLYIIGINGVMLGALFSMTATHDMQGRLLEFVFAHGLVELSCICLAGAAGAAVGEALIRPGIQSRAAAFAAANRRVLPIVLAVIVLLLGCSLIEGYVSPNPDIPFGAKILVGSGYFLFMIALLQGWLFGRRRTRPKSGVAGAMPDIP